MRALHALEYERGPREDAGLIHISYRNLGPYHIVLSHTSYSPELLNETPDIEFTNIEITRDKQEVPWRELPSTFLSEVLRDIHILTNS